MRAGPGPGLTAPDSRDTWVQSRPPARGLRGCGRGPGPPAARPCRPGCPGPGASGLRGPRLAPAAPDGVLSRTRPPGPLVAQPLLFPEPPWPAGGRQVQEARAARGAAPRTARRRPATFVLFRRRPPCLPGWRWFPRRPQRRDPRRRPEVGPGCGGPRAVTLPAAAPRCSGPLPATRRLQEAWSRSPCGQAGRGRPPEAFRQAPTASRILSNWWKCGENKEPAACART